MTTPTTTKADGSTKSATGAAVADVASNTNAISPPTVTPIPMNSRLWFTIPSPTRGYVDTLVTDPLRVRRSKSGLG